MDPQTLDLLSLTATVASGSALFVLVVREINIRLRLANLRPCATCKYVHGRTNKPTDWECLIRLDDCAQLNKKSNCRLHQIAPTKAGQAVIQAPPTVPTCKYCHRSKQDGCGCGARAFTPVLALQSAGASITSFFHGLMGHERIAK